MEVVAYCRGRYCVLSHLAVRLLTEHGFDARLAADGMLEWYGDGVPTATPNMTADSACGDPARYWDDRYERVGDVQVSWFQARPETSLDLIDALGVDPSTPVIDVGGGNSRLVDELARRGFDDVTVLDVSATALCISQRRLGDTDVVTWLRADVVTWRPERRWGLWHDRAVFHFLTDPADRATYLGNLAAGTARRRVIRHRDVRTRRPGPVLGAPRQPLRPRRPQRGRPRRCPRGNDLCVAPRDTPNTVGRHPAVHLDRRHRPGPTR